MKWTIEMINKELLRRSAIEGVLENEKGKERRQRDWMRYSKNGERPLGEIAYLYVDARYEKVRAGG